MTREPRIEAVSDEHRAWISLAVEQAAMLCAQYFGSVEGAAPTPALLDQLWVMAAPAYLTEGMNPDDLVQLVGLSLGQSLVAGLGYEWVSATDDEGHALAVRDARGGAPFFPTRAVARRKSEPVEPFVEALYRQVEAERDRHSS